jgi:hypothetical protein
MNVKNKAKTSGAQPKRISMPIRNPAHTERRDTWRAQPCGFSREEMRQIVLEMIG